MSGKPVRICFYDKLKKCSDMSGINMSKLLEIAWTHYEQSPEYAKRVLFKNTK